MNNKYEEFVKGLCDTTETFSRFAVIWNKSKRNLPAGHECNTLESFARYLTFDEFCISCACREKRKDRNYYVPL